MFAHHISSPFRGLRLSLLKGFLVFLVLGASSVHALTSQELIAILALHKKADIPNITQLSKKLSIPYSQAKKLIQEFNTQGNSLEGVAIPAAIQLSDGKSPTPPPQALSAPQPTTPKIKPPIPPKPPKEALPPKVNPPVAPKPIKKLSPQEITKIRQDLADRKTPEWNAKRKRGQMLPTAAQFSGAFQWAHKQGITGEGQSAIVMEGRADPIELRTRDLKEPSISQKRAPLKINLFLRDEYKKLDENQISLKYPSPKDVFKTGNGHQESVAHVLYQIAPRASLSTIAFQPDRFARIPGLVEKARVISYSISISVDPEDTEALLMPVYDSRLSTLKELVKNNGELKLLFQSSGNDIVELPDLSSQFMIENGTKPVDCIEATLIKDPDLQPHMILVGAVDPTFNFKYRIPGENREIQNHFITTLGVNLRSFDSKEGYALVNGTSFSTPTAAGAALLLMQKFPSLDIFQIKEILLESAARSFWRTQNTKDQFIYEDYSQLPPLYKSPNSPIKIVPFLPEYYGKGILDLRAAFIYGELLVNDLNRVKTAQKSGKKIPPRLTPQQLRTKMQKSLRDQEEMASGVIGRWYKNTKTQKKALQRAQIRQQVLEQADAFHAQREALLQEKYAALYAQEKKERDAELHRIAQRYFG